MKLINFNTHNDYENWRLDLKEKGITVIDYRHSFHDIKHKGALLVNPSMGTVNIEDVQITNAIKYLLLQEKEFNKYFTFIETGNFGPFQTKYMQSKLLRDAREYKDDKKEGKLSEFLEKNPRCKHGFSLGPLYLASIRGADSETYVKAAFAKLRKYSEALYKHLINDEQPNEYKSFGFNLKKYIFKLASDTIFNLLENDRDSVGRDFRCRLDLIVYGSESITDVCKAALSKDYVKKLEETLETHITLDGGFFNLKDLNENVNVYGYTKHKQLQGEYNLINLGANLMR